MDMGLAGKRALVTGSSAGLGAAIAKMLAEEGVGIVVHGRDEGRTKAVAKSIQESGGFAEWVTGDLGEDGAAERVADFAIEHGPIDILVNNAGAYDHVSWSDTTPELWSRTYQGNVISMVRMIKKLVPPMRERGWGRVIQIGGGLAVQPHGSHPHYTASLGARHNLTASLARELKRSGVTSNTVAPGAILVPSVERLLRAAGERLGWGQTWEEIEEAAVREIVPNDVGRLGRPEEIAAATVYLASPLADYVSGATIRVDGGTVRTV